jgi:hypothetical protein
MIGRSIGVLFVVGSGLGLVACGGKATAGSFGGDPGTGDDGSGSSNPPGGYQTPPPTYETPPPTYETPPPTYENPGGAGAEACTQLCNAFVNRTCGGQVITAEAMAACPGECRTLITEAEPCGAEYGGLLSCMFRSQFFQDLLDAACAGEEIEVSEEDAEELLALCGSQIQAFESCSGSVGPQEPDPPTEDCTPQGGCVGCLDACESCECSAGAGSETCMIICEPPA